jgi:hypothetical protein
MARLEALESHHSEDNPLAGVARNLLEFPFSSLAHFKLKKQGCAIILSSFYSEVEEEEAC